MASSVPTPSPVRKRKKPKAAALWMKAVAAIARETQA